MGIRVENSPLGPQEGDVERARNPDVLFTDRLAAARRALPAVRPDTAEGRLRQEAGLLGIEAKSELVVVRLDSRTPAEVMERGFSPNPNRQPGTLFDHIEHKGSASYVSYSLGQGNLGVAVMLAQAGISNFATERPDNQAYLGYEAARNKVKCAIDEAIKGLSPEAQSMKIRELEDAFRETPIGSTLHPRVSFLYEYAIKGVLGARIPPMEGYNLSLEDEVIGTECLPCDIVAVRDVAVLEFQVGLSYRDDSGLSRGVVNQAGQWSVTFDHSREEAARAVMLLVQRESVRRDFGFTWEKFGTPGFRWDPVGKSMAALMRTADQEFERDDRLKLP